MKATNDLKIEAERRQDYTSYECLDEAMQEASNLQVLLRADIEEYLYGCLQVL